MTFRAAIVVAMLVVVVGIAAPMTVAVTGIIDRNARGALAVDLARSRDVVREAWRSRRALESTQIRVLAEEPRLKAVVATAEIGHATVLGVAREIDRGLRSGVFLLADADGYLLADVAHPGETGHDLRDLPVVAESLANGDAAGILEDDDQVYRVTGRRLGFGDTAVGVIVLGRAVDDGLVEGVEAQTGAALVLSRGDRVLAPSRADRAVAGDAARIARTEVGEAPVELAVGDARYLASAAVLESSGGEPIRAILLASLDRALEPSRRLTTLLHALALGALALGALFAWALSRGLSGPLDRLVAFAGRVAGGDLEARSGVEGMRELRSLGAALDRMVLDLRTSREAMRAQERLERELQIASRLQTALLPSELEAPGLEIAARMRTASEVGGDYYDALPGSDGKTWLAIGDVAGHGLPAGIVMLMVRTAFAALVARDPDARPSAIVAGLNRLTYESVKGRLQTDEHVTFCALLHEGGGRFTHAGAHEDILVYRGASDTVERITTRGAWLGVSPSIERMTHDASFALEAGDVMVLVTDGVFEGETRAGKMLGVDAVGEALAGAARRDPTPSAVLAALFDFVAENVVDVHDDMTIVVVRREAA